jgi:hypothetical protein
VILLTFFTSVVWVPLLASKVQAHRDRLKLNGTHQLLVYADDVNLVGKNTHTTKKNTQALFTVIMAGDLEANAMKTM